MGFTSFMSIGIISTSIFCIFKYNSNPFALLGIIPCAALLGLVGGYATGHLVSRLNLPEGPNGGLAMAYFLEKSKTKKPVNPKKLCVFPKYIF